MGTNTWSVNGLKYVIKNTNNINLILTLSGVHSLTCFPGGLVGAKVAYGTILPSFSVKQTQEER